MKLRAGFLKKINKIDILLAKLREKEKVQTNKSRNEREDITLKTH